MSSREELHGLLAELSDEHVAEVMDYIQWLTGEAESLPEHELAAVARGEQEIARGEYVRLEELSQTLGW